MMLVPQGDPEHEQVLMGLYGPYPQHRYMQGPLPILWEYLDPISHLAHPLLAASCAKHKMFSTLL
jgi:hypothetical protein